LQTCDQNMEKRVTRMYNRGFLWKLERKLGKIAIRNLMTYIVITMGVVYGVEVVMQNFSMFSHLVFWTPAIFQGEVWRVITFIFLPPNAHFIFILFALYFYYMIGSALENEWGTFKFNVYYLCGVFSSIAAGFIMHAVWGVGFMTNFYLNMSLFFAFAILYPNFQVRLFLILPIKVKWLALLNVAFFVHALITGDQFTRIAILVSLINLALFFGKDLFKTIERWHRKNKFKRSLR